MSSSGVYVGFGFGPIQAGLFLLEAQRTGVFKHLTVAEIDAEIIELVRRNAGRYTVNVATPGGVEFREVGPVELLNPTVPAERDLLIQRIAEAREAATALPSVKYYDSAPNSPAWILAKGLGERTGEEPLVLYAAENHNRAAELLCEAVKRHNFQAASKAEYLNTVIGKMSGLIKGRRQIEKLALKPVTPSASRAFLVEEFNRILVSRPSRVTRAIPAFEEKEDLLPFEEAKLYGHNAAHALLGYLASDWGCERMPEALGRPGLLEFVRDAFVEEAGAALVAKYKGKDPLFTPEGFLRYAEDLLERMTRKSLNDAVERVIRDPARKLGSEDRFFGTIRLCLEYGTGGKRFAFGAACALAHFKPALGPQADPAEVLHELWGRTEPDLTEAARKGWKRFHAWRREGRPELRGFWRRASG